MRLEILKTKKEIDIAAAKKAAEILRKAIKKKGKAVFVAATGKSQLGFLRNLVKESIDWDKTTMFHLDEYVGLSSKHPASFRNYLKKRLINKVHPKVVNLINGNAKDVNAECRRLGRLISKVDIAFLGIGENGHIGFNEPPADFKTSKPFIVVELDPRTKKQQFKEGWFSKISDVPKKAITMSIKQIMKADSIICLAPEKRKAKAVKNCFGKKAVSNLYPASILRKHKKAFVYLDKDSAALL